jgi:hypothetical protein
MTHEFDFWLGEWDCRWKGGHGSNVVTAELDGAVILERFDGRPGTPLRGISVSVYDAEDALWRQTWVDSQRGYLDLSGRFEDGVMELRHDAREDHDVVPYRMRFIDIAPASFVWTWERFDSRVGEWTEQWRIDYARRRSGSYERGKRSSNRAPGASEW